MKEAIKKIWDEKPLVLIVLAGLFFRALAVVFSKGYGMFDDHFLVIEASQSWVDGYDYNNWLPSSGAKSPDGHSLFYSGIHFLIFKYLKWRGLVDPQAKMYIIRALHALWSLLVITYGYKIVEHYAGLKVARQAGMMLAILFFLPMMAVRNLVEFVCIPPLIIATWLMINPKSKDRLLTYVWVGLWCSVAFNIRFQTLFFIGGIGLVLLFQKQWKKFILFGLLFSIGVFSVQGIVDIYIWHRPFAELAEYVKYNYANSEMYINGPWYKYIGVLAGMILPPISLFFMFGFMRSWKKYPMLFWPSFIFFVFHSSFPNKQERFIAPVIPFVIVLGAIGWSEYVATSKYWGNHKKLLKGCWTFFWIVNCIPLPFLSTTYSKKNRVESMTYLSQQKDLRSIIIEESEKDDFNQPALYYIGRWNVHVVGVTRNYSLYKAYEDYIGDPNIMVHPNYIIFFGKDDIDKRIAAFQKMFPDSHYKITIEPSFIDKVMTFLNPVNKNQTTYIYEFDEKNVQLPPKDSVKSGH
jgi:hypothetical protein